MKQISQMIKEGKCRERSRLPQNRITPFLRLVSYEGLFSLRINAYSFRTHCTRATSNTWRGGGNNGVDAHHGRHTVFYCTYICMYDMSM